MTKNDGYDTSIWSVATSGDKPPRPTANTIPRQKISGRSPLSLSLQTSEGPAACLHSCALINNEIKSGALRLFP
jgi:hypothetical protein